MHIFDTVFICRLCIILTSDECASFIYAVRECLFMTTEVMETKKPVSAWKVKLVAGAATAMGLVSAVSADVDLNGTLGPILDSMIELIPTIIELIVAIVPAVLVMAVVGFLVSFFDSILGMLKLR